MESNKENNVQSNDIAMKININDIKNDNVNNKKKINVKIKNGML